eukprot:s15134_g1.t1
MRSRFAVKEALPRQREQSSKFGKYGKFFSNVFVEGLRRPEDGTHETGTVLGHTGSALSVQRPTGTDLGESLWGRHAPSVGITQRKWNQYIAVAMKLIEEDEVEERRKHFWRTLPPSSFLAVNRREWEEGRLLHP